MASVDKKKALFEAVLELIKEKHELSSIKVSDIAAKADIGKGTVYEYFPSKEELFMQTLLHVAWENLDQTRNSLKTEVGFKTAFLKLMEKINSFMDKNFILFRNLVMNQCGFFFKENRQEELISVLSEIRESYISLFYELIDLAVEEKVLSCRPEKADLFIALNSAMMCLVFKKKGYPEFAEYEKEDILEKSYQSFIRLLK